MSGDDVKEDNVQIAVKHLRSLPDPLEEVGILFREHQDRVFRAAYRVTGSVVDAEDVLQTIFLRLVNRKEKKDLSPSPGAYLYRAAINASLDLMRSRSRVVAVPYEEVASLSADSSSQNPETEHADRELKKHIRQSIACLGTKAAEVVALKYFEGYGNREIAEMLGMSQMVVAVVLHRARTRLRKELGKFLEE